MRSWTHLAIFGVGYLAHARHSKPANRDIEAVNDHFSNAEYWSQLHLAPALSRTPPPRGKVAVLITGQIRVESEAHLDTIARAAEGVDLFVCTYKPFEALARRFRLQGLLIVNTTYEIEKLSELRALQRYQSSDSSEVSITARLWQWLLLQRGLRHWRSQLLGDREGGSPYHTIARFRSDMHFAEGFRFRSCVGRTANGGTGGSGHGIIYAASDLFFYGTPQVFYSVFGNFFDSSIRHYHGPAPPGTTNAYRALLDERRGLRSSCLERSAFAPDPRINALDEDAQATQMFAKRTKPDRLAYLKERDAIAKTLGLPSPPSKRAKKGKPQKRARFGRKLQAKFLSGPGKVSDIPGDEAGPVLFCGCKFSLFHANIAWADHAAVSIPWKRSESMQVYQSEPSMAFHIMTHNATCLPLDLPHRETFYLFPKRSQFTFGVDSRALVGSSDYLPDTDAEESEER